MSPGTRTVILRSQAGSPETAPGAPARLMSFQGLREYARRNQLALLALIVAVIGVPTAWALGKNTVGAKQIKPNAVRAAEIKADAVRSSEVANGSLRGEDFSGGELPQGPQGERGPEGAQGPAGQDATRLFGVIHDRGDTQDSSVTAGSGVTGVTEVDVAADDGLYLVQFDRSLVGCSIQITPGLGRPLAGGGSVVGWLIPSVVSGNDLDQGSVDIAFMRADGTGFDDTSFFIAAFC